MSVVTKNGDNGKSNTFDGESLLKFHILFETIGELDELHSWIGVYKLHERPNDIYRIENIQKDIYHIMSILSTKEHIFDNTFTENDLRFIEQQIYELEKNKEITSFDVPGSSKRNAWGHVVRAKVRTCERRMVKYIELYYTELLCDINKAKLIQRYLNRLSDFIFLIIMN